MIASIVEAVSPFSFWLVIVKGSGNWKSGFVTLNTLARPPEPLAVVPKSGCAVVIWSTPLKTLPLLLTTTG
jgi:hypothetical protein